MNMSDEQTYTCLSPVLCFVQTAPGVKERLFRSVQNLLAAYQEPNQGIAIPLRFPVNADQAQCTKPTPLPRKHMPYSHAL